MDEPKGRCLPTTIPPYTKLSPFPDSKPRLMGVYHLDTHKEWLKGEIMKIVLEDSRTRRFLGSRGWTRERRRARDFQSSVAALDYCFRERLREVRILLAFDEQKFNFYLDPFLLPVTTKASRQPAN
jgi:hypothetical protein